MSGTFEQNWPVLERHVEDYRRIQQNREMILLSALARLESRPSSIRDCAGFQYRESEHVQPETLYFIPSTDVLLRIHEQDPTEDLRRYFGCIKNVTI